MSNNDKAKQKLMESMRMTKAGSDKKIVRVVLNREKFNPKRVVFEQADHLDVLKAAQIVHEEGIALLILLGRRDVIERLKEEIEFDGLPGEFYEIVETKEKISLKKKMGFEKTGNFFFDIYLKIKDAFVNLGKVKMQEKATFFIMLAVMVDAGIPMDSVAEKDTLAPHWPASLHITIFAGHTI